MIIKDMPCEKCAQCDEAFYSDDVADKLELLHTLAEAESDVAQERTAPIEETFADIRNALLARKEG